jgi:hypothetical protein
LRTETARPASSSEQPQNGKNRWEIGEIATRILPLEDILHQLPSTLIGVVSFRIIWRGVFRAVWRTLPGG